MKTIIKQNKKGQMGIIIFFFLLLTILIIGFIAAMVVGIIDFASDTITPIAEELGVVGSSNVSQAAQYSFGTLNIVVQSLPWIVGLAYVAALIFSVVFAIVVTYNPHPALLGLYFFLMILLVFGAIIMSNMYQDIYTGTDEIATRLQEQTLLSYMILYSPFILALIAGITGIYLFTAQREEGGGL